MKSGRSLLALAEELERQLATKKDLLVPTSLMHHRTDGAGRTQLTIEEPQALGSMASPIWPGGNWPTS